MHAFVGICVNAGLPNFASEYIIDHLKKSAFHQSASTSCRAVKTLFLLTSFVVGNALLKRVKSLERAFATLAACSD